MRLGGYGCCAGRCDWPNDFHCNSNDESQTDPQQVVRTMLLQRMQRVLRLGRGDHDRPNKRLGRHAQQAVRIHYHTMLISIAESLDSQSIKHPSHVQGSDSVVSRPKLLEKQRQVPVTEGILQCGRRWRFLLRITPICSDDFIYIADRWKKR